MGSGDELGDNTVLIGIIMALVGYLVTFFSTQRLQKQQHQQARALQDRQSKLTRVNAQLKSLFGPMRMLDIACFQAVTPLAKLYDCSDELAGNVEQAIQYLANCASENPASKLAHDYRCVALSHSTQARRDGA